MIQCSQNVKVQAVMMNFGDADFLSPGPFDFTDLQVSNIGAPRSVCLLLKLNALETQSLETFDNLAFAVYGQPGQLDAGRSQQVMDGAFHALTIGLESMMRQLSYEAITVAVQPSGYALSHNKKGRSSDSHLQSETQGFENNLQQFQDSPFKVIMNQPMRVDFFTTRLEERCTAIPAFVQMHQQRAGATIAAR